MFFTMLRQNMKWIIVIVVVTFAGSLLYVGGFTMFSQRQESAALAAPIAEVNGDKISYSEFHSAYRDNLRFFSQFYGPIRGRQQDELMYFSLANLVNRALILREARAQKIPVDRQAVDARVAEFRDQFPSRDAFRSWLRQQGLTEAQLREILEDNLRMERLRDTVQGDVQVTPEEAAQHIGEVRAKHILIMPDGARQEWDEAAWEAARQQALALRAEILAGADWDEMAAKHSADTFTGPTGGDVGFFDRAGPLVEEFKTAAFALPVGEISEPVRSQFGWHLIVVAERKLPEGEAYDRAEADVRRRLQEERQRQNFETWFAGVRDRARIVIHDARLRAYEHALEGRYEEAVADYRRAIAEDPQNPYLHLSLGTVYQELDQDEAALVEFERAVEKGGDDPDLLLTLAVAYRDADRRQDALGVLLRASEANPWDVDMQYAVLGLLEDMGFEEEAGPVRERLDTIAQAEEERLRQQAELQRRIEELQQEQREGAAPAEGGTADGEAQDENAGAGEGETGSTGE